MRRRNAVVTLRRAALFWLLAAACLVGIWSFVTSAQVIDPTPCEQACSEKEAECVSECSAHDNPVECEAQCHDRRAECLEKCG